MKTRRVLWLACMILLATAVAGCRGEKDRGLNRGKDVPLPADTSAMAPR